jgi:D-alanine-D-alanine ligase
MASEPLRVAVAYSIDVDPSGVVEDSLLASCGLESVEAIESACVEAGWTAWRVAVSADLPGAVEELERRRPDVVFSLVESIRDEARLEPGMAYLLEWLGIPYTGAPPLALSLALHKPVARAVLQSVGIAVPNGVVLERPDDPLADLRYPLIVKPSREDASLGISNASVVHDEATARERVRFVVDRFAEPALVEEFADGRELNVSLLGPTDDPTVLPMREIDFDLPPHLPRVVGYEAKWMPDTPEYRGTPSIRALDLDPGLAGEVESISRAAYRAIGLRDYGRVDLRLDPARGPLVVDVNPNPELLPGTGGIAGAALDSGQSFSELVRYIVEQAISRGAGETPRTHG